MRTLIRFVLPVAVVGGLVWWWVAGRSGEEPHTPPLPPEYDSIVYIDTGLDATARNVWHHTGEGSGAITLSLVEVLQNPDTETPFFESAERYGLLPSPSNAEGLPIGFAVDQFRPDGTGLQMVGVNCSMCHTGMWTYDGTAMLVDGAPNMMDVEVVFDILSHSGEVTASNPVSLFKLLVEALASEAALQEVGPTFAVAGEELAVLNRMLAAERDREHQASRRHIEASLHRAYHAASAAEADQILRQGMDAAGNGVGHPDHAPAARSVLRVARDNMRWFRDHLRMLRVIKEGFDAETESGPGRADSFDIIWDLEIAEDSIIGLGAPVSTPNLFNYHRTKWVHWDGNSNTVLERHYAQAIALGAEYDRDTHSSSVLPRSIMALEESARSLRPPAWPEGIFPPIVPELAAEGEAIFAEECAGCHAQDSATLVPLEEIGTDPRRVENFDRLAQDGLTYAELLNDLGARIVAAGIRDHDLDSTEVRMARHTDDPTWRQTGGYMARPLDGIWASPPYLHNGSVPTVWDLLHPPSERPATFAVGRELDPDDLGIDVDGQPADAWIFDTSIGGNSNAGHEHGFELTDPQKRALIEYLKTL